MSALKEEIKPFVDRLFIAQYHQQFNNLLNSLDNTSKHIIKGNKQLNQMYDLFLDYIIDSGEQLKKLD